MKNLITALILLACFTCQAQSHFQIGGPKTGYMTITPVDSCLDTFCIDSTVSVFCFPAMSRYPVIDQEFSRPSVPYWDTYLTLSGVSQNFAKNGWFIWTSTYFFENLGQPNLVARIIGVGHEQPYSPWWR